MWAQGKEPKNGALRFAFFNVNIFVTYWLLGRWGWGERERHWFAAPFIGLAKKSGTFFPWNKRQFFSFSPITSLIWIFWVCRLSPAIDFRWVEARGAAKHLPMHKTAPQQRIIWPKCQQYQEILQTTLNIFNQSQHLLHILHKSGVFFGIIHQKCCVSSSIFSIKMAAKFTNFDGF